MVLTRRSRRRPRRLQCGSCSAIRPCRRSCAHRPLLQVPAISVTPGLLVDSSVARAQAESPEPLIRLGRCSCAAGRVRNRMLVREPCSPLLEDSVQSRAHRSRQCTGARCRSRLLPVRYQGLLQSVLDDYVAAELFSNERAEAHVNIGNLAPVAATGSGRGRVKRIRTALRAEPAVRACLRQSRRPAPGAEWRRGRSRGTCSGEGLVRGCRISPCCITRWACHCFARATAARLASALLAAAESPFAEPRHGDGLRADASMHRARPSQAIAYLNRLRASGSATIRSMLSALDQPVSAD